MDKFKPFLEKIKSEFNIQFLKIHLNKDFCSLADDHRNKIRKDIVLNYSNVLTQKEQNQILNLDMLPESKQLFFSVSHCKSIGGYVVCSQKIGFDIEEIMRISEASVKRICTDRELKLVSDIRSLWTAKESIYKFFNSSQNEKFLITDINIDKTTKLGDLLILNSKHCANTIVMNDNNYLISVSF